MKTRNITINGQPQRLRKPGVKTPPRTFAEKWREKFRRRPRKHDPMLVLNMSIFNLDDGWNRTFNPVKIHENGT
jgi:hypothetical protein